MVDRRDALEERFPSIEVVRRVPPHPRGTAAGGLAAFQDLAFGVTGPATGLLADHFGPGVVFLIGGLSASLGFALAIMRARGDREPVRISSGALERAASSTDVPPGASIPIALAEGPTAGEPVPMPLSHASEPASKRRP
jgi:hypothetical protein